MESTLQIPALVTAKAGTKADTIVYWISTALFCLEMGFTAYYELLPQGAEAFAGLEPVINFATVNSMKSA
jgi:hypothetical protein